MIFRNAVIHRTPTLIAALAAAFLAGCAAMGGGAGDASEAAVKERAQMRWDALIKGSYEGAYKLTPPSYRAIYTADQYRSKFGGALKWTGAEALSAECQAEKCVVVVNVSVRPMARGRAGAPVTTAINETWVKEDGQWWFVHP